jgi:hypothetical protein
MITKINARKIKHQLNIKIFIWDWDNLIKSNLKQIMNTNYWRIKLIKKTKKRFNWRKKKKMDRINKKKIYLTLL